MAQIINDPYRNRDFSAIQKYEQETPYFNAVSSVLGGLIHGRAQELSQRRKQQQTASGLQHLLNIPAQEAHHLAGLQPEILDYVVKDRLREQKKSHLQSLFNMSPEQAEQALPLLENQEGQGLTQLMGAQEQEQAPVTNRAPYAQFQLPNAPQLPMQEQLQAAQQPVENIPEEAAAPQMAASPVQQQIQEQQAVQQAIAPQRKLTPVEQKKAEKEKKILTHEQKKQLHKEEAAAHKETQKYYDQVLSVDKAARESDNRLDRMLKLVNEGSLPFSAYYSGLKNIEEHVSPVTGVGAGGAIGGVIGGLLGGGVTAGLAAAPGAAVGTAVGGAIGGLVSPVVGVLRSIQRLTSPDTEEFEKLSSQFISGAKSIFGARITDQDLRAFMQQIPTLSNTDAGKKKIIRSMKIANEAEHARAKAMKEIIKENHGKRPADLAILVEERAQSELDKLAEKFVGESKATPAKKQSIPQPANIGGARTIMPKR